jgi:hypothetical protein
MNIKYFSYEQDKHLNTKKGKALFQKYTDALCYVDTNTVDMSDELLSVLLHKDNKIKSLTFHVFSITTFDFVIWVNDLYYIGQNSKKQLDWFFSDPALNGGFYALSDLKASFPKGSTLLEAALKDFSHMVQAPETQIIDYKKKQDFLAVTNLESFISYLAKYTLESPYILSKYFYKKADGLFVFLGVKPQGKITICVVGSIYYNGIQPMYIIFYEKAIASKEVIISKDLVEQIPKVFVDKFYQHAVLPTNHLF